MEKMTKSNSGIRFYLVDFFSFVLLILPLLPFAKDYYFICIVLYILLNLFFREILSREKSIIISFLD